MEQQLREKIIAYLNQLYHQGKRYIPNDLENKLLSPFMQFVDWGKAKGSYERISVQRFLDIKMEFEEPDPFFFLASTNAFIMPFGRYDFRKRETIQYIFDSINDAFENSEIMPVIDFSWDIYPNVYKPVTFENVNFLFCANNEKRKEKAIVDSDSIIQTYEEPYGLTLSYGHLQILCHILRNYLISYEQWREIGAKRWKEETEDVLFENPSVEDLALNLAYWPAATEVGLIDRILSFNKVVCQDFDPLFGQTNFERIQIFGSLILILNFEQDIVFRRFSLFDYIERGDDYLFEQFKDIFRIDLSIFEK